MLQASEKPYNITIRPDKKTAKTNSTACCWCPRTLSPQHHFFLKSTGPTKHLKPKGIFPTKPQSFCKTRSVLNASSCLNGSLKAAHFFSRKHTHKDFSGTTILSERNTGNVYPIHNPVGTIRRLQRQHPLPVLTCIFAKPAKTITK